VYPPLPTGCVDPTPPPMECSLTQIFGAPRGTPGRNSIPISGIAIHGLTDDTFDAYLARACLSASKAQVNCKASMHYVLDAETGRLSSLVPEADLAWAWQSYRGNFPVTTPLDTCPCIPPCPTPPCPVPPDPQAYPGWPVLSAAFPNLSADFYTINIGITHTIRPEQQALEGVNCCIGPYGIGEVAYRNLVRLIAWIVSNNPSIPVDAQHIAFHDAIVNVPEINCLEFPCGPNNVCLVCDVSSYCEACPNKSDPLLSPTV